MPSQIVQVPPEAFVKSKTKASEGNIANYDLSENEPIVIEEIPLSTVAAVPVMNQIPQIQPLVVEPEVPKIECYQP